MAESLTEGLIETLQGAMFVLDTPGAMVRSAIGGGNPLAAAVDQDARIYGRDLLRQWGMIGPEDTWGNFAGGVATEIALDPLNALFLGAGQLSRARHLAKVGRANTAVDAANVAAKARYADDVARGFMPADVAAATKIVDEAGDPLRLYHGAKDAPSASPNVPSKRLRPVSPAGTEDVVHFGPAYYMTDDPGVAGTFAAQHATQVEQPMWLLDWAGKADPIDTLAARIGASGSPKAGAMMHELNTPGSANQLKALLDEAGIAADDVMRQTVPPEPGVMHHFVDARNPLLLETPEGQAAWKAAYAAKPDDPRPVLQEMGYDAIVGSESSTWGGELASPLSGGARYNVTAVLDPAQAYLPYVAEPPVPQPALQPRRRLPLVPALAGYNAAQAVGR